MADNLKTPLISVVLCTYNPRADSLERVIDGLKQQTLPRERWEFVVVDNNSQPAVRVSKRHTADGMRQEGTGDGGQGTGSGEGIYSREKAQEDLRLTDLKLKTAELELGWHPEARMVVEMQQGLSHARRRGFQEAKGDLIVNLDDDAVLDPDYLEQVTRLAQRFPFIGAFGCQLRAEFETPPDRPSQEYYAAERTVAEDIWSNDREHIPSTPFGAGSVVRRQVADAYTLRMQEDPRWGMLGRTAEKLLSCEDIEIAMTACDLGFGKGLFKDLRLTHLILAKKMTDDFLSRNAYGNGYSSVVHNYLRFGRVPQEPGVFAKANRLYRLWRMTPRQRRQECAKDAGIAAGVEIVARLSRDS